MTFLYCKTSSTVALTGLWDRHSFHSFCDAKPTGSNVIDNRQDNYIHTVSCVKQPQHFIII